MTTQEWAAPDQWVTPTLPIGPRPAWVKSLGRYGRAAYEWNRRYPAILLPEQYYLDLQIWVETEVQALMEDWNRMDPESEEWWEKFGYVQELVTDHPMELRILAEPSVCRRLVFQPTTEGCSEPLGGRWVSEADRGLVLNTGPQDEDHEIQTLIWKAANIVADLIQMWEQDETLESGLEWFMPTAGEVVLAAVNNDSRMLKEGLRIEQYPD